MTRIDSDLTRELDHIDRVVSEATTGVAAGQSTSEQIAGLLAGVRKHATRIDERSYHATRDARQDARHIIRMSKLATPDRMAAIVSYATRIKKRCHKLPDIVSVCNSIIEKATAAQRLLEVKP